MEKNTALEALSAAKKANEEAKGQEIIAVYAALNAGLSWTQIGAQLGLTKQTAHARHNAGYKRHKATGLTPEDAAEAASALAALQAVDARKTAEETADDVAGPSVTPSIFSDATAPARAASIHGQRTVDVFQQFAADRKATKEDQERADFWEAKRKYVVTVDGAIYSPRGENGWDLHKVMRNDAGRNHQQRYSDMSELIAAYEGLLYISRDKYDGLVKNAAADRECWIMAATKKENSVTAGVELTREINAMTLKLDAIDKKLKAKR